jgi:small subunit ribosomal protein S11
MGKKRIIQKSSEEVLAEKEKIDKALKKESGSSPARKVEEGHIYILSSYNNTIISLTNKRGEVLAWTSAGAIGFKGTRKATPFAASKVAEAIGQKAKRIGVAKIKIFVKGVGSGRESALRSFGNQSFEVTAIEDITPLPHNGCRPRKQRRV